MRDEPAARPWWLPVLLVLVALVGVGLVVAGAAIVQRGPVSVGWFAYAPLQEELTYPSTPWRWAPYLIGAGGLLVGGAAGYALGERRRRPR